MPRVCITGSTDGIGLAAARQLLSEGHEVVVHARSAERGRPVAEELGCALVVGDLAVLDDVRALADAIGEVDVLAHNAGVWVRGDTPVVTPDGFETTFGVNVLAPHLLTTLLRGRVRDRVVWLGSGMVGSGRLKPTALGGERRPRQAYADSKAADVALSLAWTRRGVPSVALDPGWVPTKLASAGAPGRVEDAGDGLAFACTGDVDASPYWQQRTPAPVPGRLRDAGLQDAVAAACDRLLGL